MKNMEPRPNSIESGKVQREKIMEKYFNNHLAVVMLSTLLALAPGKKLQAQETKTQESATHAEVQPSLEKEVMEKLNQLREVFGPILDKLISIHSKRQGHAEIIDRLISFQNIDAVPGLSSEELQDFLSNTYPKKFASGSISKIEFSGKSESNETVGEVFGKVIPLDKLLLNSKPGDDLRAPMVINLPEKGIDRDLFIEILRHEIGHNNDWRASPFLTFRERISMLHEVYLRCISKDRYISEYVEGYFSVEDFKSFSLKLKETNSKEEYEFIEQTFLKSKEQSIAYMRVSEYWAEIQKAYFEDKQKLEQEHPKDFALVKKWVAIITK